MKANLVAFSVHTQRDESVLASGHLALEDFSAVRRHSLSLN
jgi:hypothetical protein